MSILTNLRATKPLILNITNQVTMDFIANGLLSLGASPMMSSSSQESYDLIKLANCVVINIGTLNDEFLAVCHHVCRIANELHKPIIFDPVGAGASQYRTEACLRLIDQFQIAILRGNANEIMSLLNSTIMTKGVDGTLSSIEAIPYAKQLSIQYDMAVVISGATDVVVDSEQIHQNQLGDALMTKVTGAGCLHSAIIAAFHAIEPNRYAAGVAANIFYSQCGEYAAHKSQGPGTFKLHLLDALHALYEIDNA